MTGLAERRGAETAVYQPAEDSGLLAEVAADAAGPGDRVLEVGVGSGWVAERVAETGATVVGSDVNPHACRAARDRGIEVVCADLVAPFCDGAFDAVLFNPPYLPRNEAAERDDWVERALTAGDDGRAVVNPFLDAATRVLAPGGAVYLLVSSLTGVDAVRERAAANGLASEVLREERYPFEQLVVLALRPDADARA